MRHITVVCIIRDGTVIALVGRIRLRAFCHILHGRHSIQNSKTSVSSGSNGAYNYNRLTLILSS